MPGSPTTNIGLVQNTIGGDSGTWGNGQGINGNNATLDLILGGTATITLSNANVVLNAAQFQSKMIVFQGTLSANVAITFPASFTKSYEILNGTANSSVFTVTLTSTVGGGSVAVPYNETVDIISNTLGGISFKNFGRIGTYWDYAGSSVPNWVTACSRPPYLNCDGTTFSSASYPALAIILGGTTLPDTRGRSRFALNQGTGRITTAAGGLDGDTNLASGGSQTTTLSSQNIPPVPYTDPGHTHTYSPSPNIVAAAGPGATAGQQSGSATTSSAVTNITIGSTSPTSFSNVPPGYVGGLTLIRAG